MFMLSNDFTDIYERSLPLISTSVDDICIELFDTYSGMFFIENVGGGVLRGKIASDDPVVALSVSDFECNYLSVEFSVDIRDLCNRDSLNCSIVIHSNGGEKVVPVFIKVLLHSFYSDSGIKISSLDQFFIFAAENKSDAVDIFLSEKFKFWLDRISPGYVNIYNRLLLDGEKSRALDNFLRLAFNVDCCSFELDKECLEFDVAYSQKSFLTGSFVVKKSDFFFLSCSVSCLLDLPWLSLTTSVINDSDFNESLEAVVTFVINPMCIVSSKVRNKIIVKSDVYSKVVEVVVRKQPVFTASLSKESFYFSDSGFVFIQNNTGDVLEINVLPKDNFIRFEAKKFFVKENTRIPFHIKYPLGALAYLSLTKNKPDQLSEISIKVTYDKQFIRKRLKVLMGHG